MTRGEAMVKFNQEKRKEQFDMADPEGSVLYAMRNAYMNLWPFPHFYAENVFPRRFYDNLLEKLEKKTDFNSIKGLYNGRTFSDDSDFPELSFMNTGNFLKQVAKIFAPFVKMRFPEGNAEFFSEVRLIRDGLGYSIGPHTDAAWKVVSLLFYLPKNQNYKQYGTSIYTPKDPNYYCPGGPHHERENFNLIHTAEFKPNTCFGFFKTDQSFHGVEPVNVQFNRDILLFNIYSRDVYLQHHKPAAE